MKLKEILLLPLKFVTNPVKKLKTKATENRVKEELSWEIISQKMN